MIRQLVPCILIAFMLAAGPSLAMPDIDFQVPDPRTEPAQAHAATDIFVDLDLSSGRECVPSAMAFEAEKWKQPTILLDEGDSVRTASKHCMFTAAEYFAARQVMNNKPQLELTIHGIAKSGSIIFDEYTAKHCRNMYVPKKVVLVQNATTHPAVNIQGELHIGGAYMVTGKAQDCSIKAKRIKLNSDSSITISSPHINRLSLISKEVEVQARETPIRQESSAADSTISDTVYSKDKRGYKHVEAVVNSNYVLKTTQTDLVHSPEEFIPVEGQDEAVEVGLYRQQRESCQLKRKE